MKSVEKYAIEWGMSEGDVAARDAEVRADAVQRCVDAAISWHRAGCSRVPSGLTDAIRAVATPPEPKPNIIINGKRVHREVVRDDGYTRIEFTKEDTSGKILCWEWIEEESPRERLGRVLYCAIHSDGTRLWECLTADNRERHYVAAAAVIAEKARIDAEFDERHGRSKP